MRLIKGLIGFCIAFALVVMLEIALVVILSSLFNLRITPRGLGWIIVPFAGGALGWSVGRDFDWRLFSAYFTSRNLRIGIDLKRITDRFWVACTVFWIFCAGIYSIFFVRYGYRFDVDELVTVLSLVFAPPAIGFVGLHLLNWALVVPDVSNRQ